MKTEFKFSNLLGTVYGRGNLVFTPDGNSLLSPVGNRVSVFNLTKNTSYTLPFSHRKNIVHLNLTPDGNLLLTIDEDGRAILSVFPRRIAIYHFTFKAPVTSLSFSPNGRYFVVGLGRKIQAWRTPSTPSSDANGELEFAPFILHREYGGHFDEVRHLSWSGDSRFFLSASKDLTARIWSLDPEEGFEPTVLAGHRQQVRGVWFSADQESVFTVSEDGALFRWEFVPSPHYVEDEDPAEAADERWRIVQKDFFMQNGKLKCACFHPSTGLLTVCFDNGRFSLYELPSFSNIHSLSMANSPISAVVMNKTGEWLAFGSAKTGQLLVWEHASESNILKQSSHLDALTTLTYSPDSTRIITGADDGLIKIWDVSSGFHIATFTEHSSAVTASAYSKRGNVLFTSSLDGSDSVLDGRRDVSGGRTLTSRRTAASAPGTKSFNTITYSADGSCLLAAGNSKYICLYSVSTLTLIKKFTVSINLSLDGTQEFLNSAAIMSNGLPRDMIDTEGENSDLEDRIDRGLPGVKRGRDATARTIRPEVRVTSVEFAPTGQSFCASSTEGLLIYSLDNSGMDEFDPFDLDLDVTPQNIRAILKQKEPEYLKALIMAFRLNEKPLLRQVYESIPYTSVPLLVRELPKVYLGRLLMLLGQQMEHSPHLEFALRWVSEVLSVHGRYIKERSGEFASELRAVLRGVEGIGKSVRSLGERNSLEIEFLCQHPPAKSKALAIMSTDSQDPNDHDAVMGDEDDHSDWIGLG
ncbi:periodic tryptophan protein-like protein 2, partial [Aureobasidium melanogenum]